MCGGGGVGWVENVMFNYLTFPTHVCLSTKLARCRGTRRSAGNVGRDTVRRTCSAVDVLALLSLPGCLSKSASVARPGPIFPFLQDDTFQSPTPSGWWLFPPEPTSFPRDETNVRDFRKDKAKQGSVLLSYRKCTESIRVRVIVQKGSCELWIN